MKRLVLLVFTSVLGGAAVLLPQAQYVVPQILARVSLAGLNHPLPLTNVFTPRNDGPFRVSLYLEGTKYTPPGSGYGNACLTVLWTDDSLINRGSPIDNNRTGVNCIYIGESDVTEDSEIPLALTIRAKGGTPITFQTALDSGIPPTAEYSIFGTVEGLAP